jgi:hypothetical protein
MEKSYTFKAGTGEVEIILSSEANSENSLLYHLYIHDKKIDGYVYFNKRNLGRQQVLQNLHNFMYGAINMVLK